MKKYIYGTVLIAVIVACSIFLSRPPEVGERIKPMTLAITFRFPEGYEFTRGAPFVLTWRVETPKGILSVPVVERNFNPFISPFPLVFSPMPGSQSVILNARLYYCHKSSRMCFQDDFEVHVPLNLDGTQAMPWIWDITPKKT